MYLKGETEEYRRILNEVQDKNADFSVTHSQQLQRRLASLEEEVQRLRTEYHKNNSTPSTSAPHLTGSHSADSLLLLEDHNNYTTRPHHRHGYDSPDSPASRRRPFDIPDEFRTSSRRRPVSLSHHRDRTRSRSRSRERELHDDIPLTYTRDPELSRLRDQLYHRDSELDGESLSSSTTFRNHTRYSSPHGRPYSGGDYPYSQQYKYDYSNNNRSNRKHGHPQQHSSHDDYRYPDRHHRRYHSSKKKKHKSPHRHSSRHNRSPSPYNSYMAIAPPPPTATHPYPMPYPVYPLSAYAPVPGTMGLQVPTTTPLPQHLHGATGVAVGGGGVLSDSIQVIPSTSATHSHYTPTPPVVQNFHARSLDNFLTSPPSAAVAPSIPGPASSISSVQGLQPHYTTTRSHPKSVGTNNSSSSIVPATKLSEIQVPGVSPPTHNLNKGVEIQGHLRESCTLRPKLIGNALDASNHCIRWYRYSSTGPYEFICTSPTRNLDKFDVGKYIKMTYIPLSEDNKEMLSESIEVFSSRPVGPPPVQVQVELVGDPYEGNELRAVVHTLQGTQGHPPKMIWYRGHKQILEGSLVYPLQATDVGSSITIHYTPRDAEDDPKQGPLYGPTTASVSPVIRLADPQLIDLQFVGEPRVGGEVQVRALYRGGAEGPSIITWYRENDREGSKMIQENSPAIRLTPEDQGSILRVDYTPVRADGQRGPIQTLRTKELIGEGNMLGQGAASFMHDLVCSGDHSCTEGQELTAVLPDDVPGDVQWFRGADPIPDAHSRTYTLTNADVGYRMKYIFHPFTGGCVEAVTRHAITASNPTAANLSFNNAHVGDPLTAEYNYLGGIEGDTSFAWWKSFDGSNWKEIRTIAKNAKRIGGFNRFDGPQTYLTNANDTLSYIKVQVLPARTDNIKSRVPMEAITRLRLEPTFLQKLRKFLHDGVRRYNLFNADDGSEAKITLTNNSVTVQQGKQAPPVKVSWNKAVTCTLDEKTDNSFYLNLNTHKFKFKTGDPDRRNVFVIAFRAFAGMADPHICNDLLGKKAHEAWGKKNYRVNQVAQKDISDGLNQTAPNMFVTPKPISNKEIPRLKQELEAHSEDWLLNKLTLAALLPSPFGQN